MIAELGHMPTRSELEARGLSGLYKAMRRDGADWSHLLVAAPPVTVDPEQIAIAAYFLHANGTPGDPVDHWLEAERQLTAV